MHSACSDTGYFYLCLSASPLEGLGSSRLSEYDRERLALSYLCSDTELPKLTVDEDLSMLCVWKMATLHMETKKTRTLPTKPKKTVILLTEPNKTTMLHMMPKETTTLHMGLKELQSYTRSQRQLQIKLNKELKK